MRVLYLVMSLGCFFTSSGVLQAQEWSESNNFSRIVVHEFCGDPEQEPLKTQLKNAPCFCWNRFAGDPDNPDDAMVCKVGTGTESTPNYFGNALRRNVVLEHMFKVLYGDVGGEEWCVEFNGDGNSCSEWISYLGNNDDRTEAFVVGHFVAAIVGMPKCLDAKLDGNDDWHEGTFALAELDLSFLKLGGLRNRFDAGCRIDYQMVWEEKKKKAGQ